MPADPILRDIPDHIDSPRLSIRPPRAGDGQMLFEAVCESLADLRRFPASLPWAIAEPSLEASEKFCREGHANFLARRDLPLLLLLKPSGALVGASGLHRIDWRVPKFELGFWGRAPRQGQGLVTEGAGEIVKLAFTKLGARRVEALVDEANERGCRVCERLGFALEGTLRNERVDPNGALRSTRVYAITRSSMRRRHAHLLPATLLTCAAASFVHHAHNAEFLSQYPNMPGWLSPALVYMAWLATTAVGLSGYALLRRGHRAAGLAMLALYGAAGLYSLAHYSLAPPSAHTVMMNLTIGLEAGTAMLLLGALLVSTVR